MDRVFMVWQGLAMTTSQEPGGMLIYKYNVLQYIVL